MVCNYFSADCLPACRCAPRKNPAKNVNYKIVCHIVTIFTASKNTIRFDGMKINKNGKIASKSTRLTRINACTREFVELYIGCFLYWDSVIILRNTFLLLLIFFRHFVFFWFLVTKIAQNFASYTLANNKNDFLHGFNGDVYIWMLYAFASIFTVIITIILLIKQPTTTKNGRYFTSKDRSKKNEQQLTIRERNEECLKQAHAHILYE